jgi:hypothetical protein
MSRSKDNLLHTQCIPGASYIIKLIRTRKQVIDEFSRALVVRGRAHTACA